jgi:hypothetical protein
MTQLLPGEDGLFELVDAIAETFEADRSELVDDRSRRRMNEIAADWDLHDGPGTLGDLDESGRVSALQFVEADAVHRSDLVRIRNRVLVGDPEHERRHHIAGAGWIVVETAEQVGFVEFESDFFVRFAHGSFERGLARIDAPTRERPLPSVGREMTSSPGEKQRCATGGSVDAPRQIVRIGARDASEVTHALDLSVVAAVQHGVRVEHDQGDSGMTSSVERMFAHIVCVEMRPDAIA